MREKRTYLLIALAAGLGLALTATVLGASGGPPVSSTAHLLPAPPGTTITETVYLPVVMRDYPGMTVNPQIREDSLEFYHRVYLASAGVVINWTGNHSTCNAGTTSQAFRDAVLLRINYFRAMAGVSSDVLLSAGYNDKAQQAALMMSANGQLNHYPPSSWVCYSADGDDAAGHSNLCLGCYGPGAIDAYMHDNGAGNYFAGHRRWILYPPMIQMGTGDIPPGAGYSSANALWVIGGFGPRPVTREPYVAWPPPGYVPYMLVYPRWSFSVPGADFASATVSMSSGGESIPVALNKLANGYGDNALVWEPAESFGSAPPADKSYSVSVSNVLIEGMPTDFSYDVIAFDPDRGRVGWRDRFSDAQLGTPLFGP